MYVCIYARVVCVRMIVYVFRFFFLIFYSSVFGFNRSYVCVCLCVCTLYIPLREIRFVSDRLRACSG